jgi:hypothetical protein
MFASKHIENPSKLRLEWLGGMVSVCSKQKPITIAVCGINYHVMQLVSIGL